MSQGTGHPPPLGAGDAPTKPPPKTPARSDDVTVEVHTRGPAIFRMKRSQLRALAGASIGAALPEPVMVKWNGSTDAEWENVALHSLNRANVGFVLQRGSA